VAAEVRVARGLDYILLMRGPVLDVQRRDAQVQNILGGLDITGLGGVDLSMARPGLIDAALSERLAAYVTSAMSRFGVTGASLAVTQSGAIAYARGFGVKEAGGSDPVTPETSM
jgi:hypothetical protein